MRFKPAYLFSILCILFLAYSFSVYTSTVPHKINYNKQIAAEGKLVWQRHNCQSCHQLYGLGGYLGPDLTNICSTPGKDFNYIRAILATGTTQMPAFELTREEQASLMEFLRSANASGTADPRRFNIESTGMITQDER
jgi:nitric oxide reductase subunit C